MLGGYTGKVLNIDLTEGIITEETFGEEVLRKFIGGSGLGAKILYERTTPDTEPLSPENPLIYMTGPLTGTKVPASGRHEITAISPLTGIFGEGDAGGTWGMNLKKAGFDGIIITGRAESPVYIFIQDGKARILDGRDLWGLDTFQTDQKIKEIHGQNSVVSCIGPAGEKQVLIAGIMHDGKDARAVGRTGLGAVMGAKNLKAVAVSGTGRIPVADEEGLRQNLKQVLPGIVEKTKTLGLLGTAGGVVPSETIGDLPIKNWKQGGWEDAEKISGQKMAETILRKRYYCGSCPIGCGRDVEIKEGPYKGVDGAGPEYETLGMLGSCCLINDLEAVAYAADLCNRYGLDTISTGGVIAFAMELYEHGLITKDDLGGIELTWGNAGAAIELIKKIANKEGIGELLGMGVKKAADKIGGLAHEFAIHTKGLELPAHDPRAFNSLAVGYATSNRGACHLQGATYFFEKTATMPEIGYKEPQDRHGTEGKGRLNFYAQNIMCLMDSLKLCKFLLYGGVTLTMMTQWIKYVVGWDITVDELLETGERIFNLKRLYNTQRGISRKDDTIPMRILTQPRRDKGAGENLPPFGKMLNEYYQIRGWTDEGIPKQETLKRLGLTELT
ncbi:putative oxidoreductase YdhV [Koleobacter methoxysyntrophicus]|uniref:Putative oxidoreductase YdhV n=1 Tax=Koleobacter methoxysyntrophicus TaxID=2751313 RepID=A0A8A0RJK5_9FIRM|nr:aldehyde ferredoxin oxidoreductase family protein [Koleobacter methoxysyntrophicus]QSQ07729.1 putative oxidoreductase YdhV [Koleobacter methoxysyntrophicus]